LRHDYIPLSPSARATNDLYWLTPADAIGLWSYQQGK
jgi:hypothetical protein